MSIIKTNTILLCLIFGLMDQLSAQNRPFPQSLDYPNCIKPQNVNQTSMNRAVTTYYQQWKSDYLRESNGETPGGYYIYSHPDDNEKKSVSEAHGYGMLIMALMAGYEQNAQIYFDGMYAMYNDHRSTGDNDLMSWIIHPNEDRTQDGNNATDGDMDIAYALLLADYQWSSTGAINYKAEASRMITNGLKESNINNKRLMLGDWWHWNSRWDWATRTLDWMPGHLRAYHQVTDDFLWLAVADTIYSLINAVTINHAPSTGLMPDFVNEADPRPAPGNFLESPYDGAYNWNACRYPWRIATDFAHNGTQEAKIALDNILTWIKKASQQNPNQIKAGYLLDGTPIPDRNYSSMAYTAPIIAACIVNSSHQNYLNMGWNIIDENHSSYYADTINLLSMLLISGNWWNPVQSSALPPSGQPGLIPENGTILEQNFPNPFNPDTRFEFYLARAAHVKLSIFDLQGVKVATIINKHHAPGRHLLKYNAGQLASGLYQYRLETSSGWAEAKKMIVLK